MSAFAIDWVGTARVYVRDLEKQVQFAKEHPDARYAWQQCELSLKGLEDAVAEMPVGDRAPFAPKIKEWKPIIEAGAARNRAGIVARRIQDTLDTARDEIEAKRDPTFYFDKVNDYLAEPDLKALPADELTKLKTTLAELKKRAGK